VTAYSLHPGGILTQISSPVRTANVWWRDLVIALLDYVIAPSGMFKTMSQGTATTLYCALRAPVNESGEREMRARVCVYVCTDARMKANISTMRTYRKWREECAPSSTTRLLSMISGVVHRK
jgi:hypothetical protein